ncbi:hypothetical protein MPC1_3600001 [Methylocella tundrae]|nr:hypothetical protein MPC1_3600001 [Methylocella tundrae]
MNAASAYRWFARLTKQSIVRPLSFKKSADGAPIGWGAW